MEEEKLFFRAPLLHVINRRFGFRAFLGVFGTFTASIERINFTYRHKTTANTRIIKPKQLTTMVRMISKR